MAAKLPPRYPATCRNLSPSQIEANLKEDKPFVVRMAVPPHAGDATTSTTFRDELRGDITFEHSNVDDQVLMKSDGFPTYHLANVVDDHLMQITDVIRAEEWISSTPKHVLLYRAFGWQLPRFWHMPLLRNLDKSKISKRKNPVSLIYYRQAGFLPEAVINFLGLMGGGMPESAGPVAEKFSLAEMVERFDVKNIRLGGPVFDLTKLKWLNGEYLRSLAPEAFYKALRDTVLNDTYLSQIASLVQTPASKRLASSATSPTFSSPTTSSPPPRFSSRKNAPWKKQFPLPPNNSRFSKPLTGHTKLLSQP